VFLGYCIRHWPQLARHANNNCYFLLHPNNITNLLLSSSLHFHKYNTPLRVKDHPLPFTNFVHPHLSPPPPNLSDACQLFFLVHIIYEKIDQTLSSLSLASQPYPYTTLSTFHRSFFDLFVPFLSYYSFTSACSQL
jgi:hypothetical protein